jgi:hypothetical protein
MSNSRMAGQALEGRAPLSAGVGQDFDPTALNIFPLNRPTFTDSAGKYIRPTGTGISVAQNQGIPKMTYESFMRDIGTPNNIEVRDTAPQRSIIGEIEKLHGVKVRNAFEDSSRQAAPQQQYQPAPRRQGPMNYSGYGG